MKSKLKKLLVLLSLLLAGLMIFVGTGFVFMYVWEAIIVRIDEPDQSLLFWYLPILFLGLAGISAGIALLTRGVKLLKRGE